MEECGWGQSKLCFVDRSTDNEQVGCGRKMRAAKKKFGWSDETKCSLQQARRRRKEQAVSFVRYGWRSEPRSQKDWGHGSKE